MRKSPRHLNPPGASVAALLGNLADAIDGPVAKQPKLNPKAAVSKAVPAPLASAITSVLPPPTPVPPMNPGIASAALLALPPASVHPVYTPIPPPMSLPSAVPATGSASISLSSVAVVEVPPARPITNGTKQQQQQLPTVAPVQPQPATLNVYPPVKNLAKSCSLAQQAYKPLDNAATAPPVAINSTSTCTLPQPAYMSLTVPTPPLPAYQQATYQPLASSSVAAVQAQAQTFKMPNVQTYTGYAPQSKPASALANALPPCNPPIPPPASSGTLLYAHSL